jgi:hypothetical protein
MRRLMAASLLLSMVTLAPAGCKRRNRARAAPVDDTGPALSVVNVADPEAASQLFRGFYGLENDAWRWTMSHFSATLRPPEGASRNGARLELTGNLPEAVFKRTGRISLSAMVNGHPLPPETLSKAGGFTYSRDVPASALGGAAASVEFATDKALAPGDVDERELALIVTSVGLVPVLQNDAQP